MNHLKLSYDVLDIGKISDIASADSCGAISLFVGTTRDSFEGKQVLSLEYEAYEQMALKQLEVICKGLRNQWPDIVNIAICHRLGVVGIGEASVVIAISSPHRQTSLNAVAIAIEDLKKNVPIWKKELYKEDEAAWKENKESKNGCSYKSNFNENICCIEDPQTISNSLVQISACEDEIKRRIKSFVEKKRSEIDLCNIMDFTDMKHKIHSADKNNRTQEELENELMACARVSSNIIKQEYSKCHLKVRRVENNIGPQTRPDYLYTLDKLMVPIGKEKPDSRVTIDKKEDNQRRSHSKEFSMLKYPAILERLENIEDHFNIPQSKTKTIYQRLKIIEDRLLYLESISPEYVHFLGEKSQVTNTKCMFDSSIEPTVLPAYGRKLYSAGEIDTIIQNFEERNIERHNCNVMD